MQALQSPSVVHIPEMEGLRLPRSTAAAACPGLPRRGRRPRSSVRAAAAPSAAAPRRETDRKKRVVVTGMGLVSVFGNDVDAFYERLLQGESGVGPIDRFDVSKYPTRFAAQIRGFTSDGYIDGKNDRRLDDCLRYALVGGKRALESSGLPAGGADMEKVPPEVACSLHLTKTALFLCFTVHPQLHLSS